MRSLRGLCFMGMGALTVLVLGGGGFEAIFAEAPAWGEWPVQKVGEHPLPLDPDEFAVYRTVTLKGEKLLVVDNDLDWTRATVAYYKDGRLVWQTSLPTPVTAADVCPDGLVLITGQRVSRVDEGGRLLQEWTVPGQFYLAQVVCTADGIFVAYVATGVVQIQLYSSRGTLLKSLAPVPVEWIRTARAFVWSFRGFPNYAGKALLTGKNRGEWFIVDARGDRPMLYSPSEDFWQALENRQIRRIFPVMWQGREALLVGVSYSQRLPLEDYVRKYGVPPEKAQDLRDLLKDKPDPTVPVSLGHQLWVLDLRGRPLGRIAYSHEINVIFPTTTDATGDRWVVLQEPLWPPRKHRYIWRVFALGAGPAAL